MPGRTSVSRISSKREFAFVWASRRKVARDCSSWGVRGLGVASWLGVEDAIVVIRRERLVEGIEDVDAQVRYYEHV